MPQLDALVRALAHPEVRRRTPVFVQRAEDLVQHQQRQRLAGTLGLDELARRLKVSPAELGAIAISYTKFQIPKRTGGTRTPLCAPSELMTLIWLSKSASRNSW